MSERLFLHLEGDHAHGPESTAPAGTLHQRRVGSTLDGYIAHLLVYREALPKGADVLERVLPDGAVRLVFNLGDAPSTGTASAHRVQAIGASAAPVVVKLRGRIEGVSVALRPGAASAVLGVPASELAGRSVHLDELWGGEASRLLSRMAEASDDDARLALLEQALLQRLRRADARVEVRASRAATLIAQSGGRLPLARVAEAVGVGERRLQQLFNAHVGLAPRAWLRLQRLRACLRVLRQSPAPSWAQMALDAGYYDQAHLTNDFRALCGVTPREYLRHLARSAAAP